MYSIPLPKVKTLLVLPLISLTLLSTSCSPIEHTAMGLENESVSETSSESTTPNVTEVTTNVLNYDPTLTLYSMYEPSTKHTTTLPETAISSVMTTLTNGITTVTTTTSTASDTTTTTVSSSPKISVNPVTTKTKTTTSTTTSVTTAETTDATTTTTEIPPENTTLDETTEVIQSEPTEYIQESEQTTVANGFEDTSNTDTNATIDENYFFNGDCAFIGDSLTVGISTYGYVPTETTFAKEGISLLAINSLQLSTSCGYVYPAQAIAGWKSKHVYILLGINGVTWVNTDTAIERYTQLINDILANSPYVEDINIISVYPVAYSMETKSSVADGRILNSEVDAFNQRLQTMANQMGLNYIDVNSKLKNEYGCLPDSLTVDGLHLTQSGYEKVRDILLEYVQQNS